MVSEYKIAIAAVVGVILFAFVFLLFNTETFTNAIIDLNKPDLYVMSLLVYNDGSWIVKIKNINTETIIIDKITVNIQDIVASTYYNDTLVPETIKIFNGGDSRTQEGFAGNIYIARVEVSYTFNGNIYSQIRQFNNDYQSKY